MHKAQGPEPKPPSGDGPAGFLDHVILLHSAKEHQIMGYVFLVILSSRINFRPNHLYSSTKKQTCELKIVWVQLREPTHVEGVLFQWPIASRMSRPHRGHGPVSAQSFDKSCQNFVVE